MNDIECGREDGDELPDEIRFDYANAKPNRFAGRLKDQQILVALDADVAAVFENAETVNRVFAGADRDHAAEFSGNGLIAAGAGGRVWACGVVECEWKRMVTQTEFLPETPFVVVRYTCSKVCFRCG